MKTISKAGALLLLATLILAAPAAGGDADRAATVRKARADTQALAERFAEMVKDLVAEGRIDEARETLANLDRILDLLAGLDKLVRRLEGPDVIKAEPPGPGRAGRVVRDVPVVPVPRGPQKPVEKEEPVIPEPQPPNDAVRAGTGGAGGALVVGGAGGAFGGRGGHRNLRSEGGGAATQQSVDLALEWLKNHQDPDGFWDCDGFWKQCRLNRCDGSGYALYDPGVTGLALMAFLGAGETHKHGNYQSVVKDAGRYLKQIQDPEGCFGPRTTAHFTYGHAIDAMAMTELYALTQSPLFKQSAQQAMDFIEHCRNPYLAWRYGVHPQDNDTSVSGWMVCALWTGKQAGLRVADEGFEGMKAWLAKVTEPEYGRVGYTARGTGPARPADLMDKFPADKSEALTAVGVFSRVLLGENPWKSEMIQKGTDLCMKTLPVWDEKAGSIDMYYWYYGTLAMFQVGGDPWKRWNEAMKAAVIDHQRREGDQKGSWDPVGAWGKDGGRVYSTALGALTLETYYRYPRVFRK